MSFGWIVTASIAKKANAIAASVAASPSMLSSRLNAFVIPTSQSERERASATHLRVDELDVGAGREHDRRRGDLDAELRERRQRPEVVDSPATKSSVIPA